MLAAKCNLYCKGAHSLHTQFFCLLQNRVHNVLLFSTSDQTVVNHGLFWPHWCRVARCYYWNVNYIAFQWFTAGLFRKYTNFVRVVCLLSWENKILYRNNTIIILPMKIMFPQEISWAAQHNVLIYHEPSIIFSGQNMHYEFSKPVLRTS